MNPLETTGRYGAKARRFLGWIAVLLPAVAQAFNIAVHRPAGGGVTPMPPALSLDGLTPGRYAIESSADLLAWRRVATNRVDVGDTLVFPLGASPDRPLFYRGIRLPVLPDATVDAIVDPAVSVSGVITPEAGGTLVLTNGGGTRYTFEVGPGNVVEPVLVRMTEATGFTRFPAQNAMRAAVVFEPDGFQFHGGGLLTIGFPTNVPHLRLSSFAFTGPDRHFGFVPDLVATNSARVPVTHFSGVGTALWEPTEWDLAAMVEVQNAYWAEQRDISRWLWAERARLMEGQPGSPTLNADLIARMHGFYDAELKPLFAAAASDCGLATYLVRQTLGLERQLQLLGVSDGRSLLQAPEFAAWQCNCLHEAEAACEDQSIDAATFVRSVLGIERESALMDYSALDNCGTTTAADLMTKIQNGQLPCAPEWMGTLSYRESGRQSHDWDDWQAWPAVYQTPYLAWSPETRGTTSRHSSADESIAFEGEVSGADLIRHVQLSPVFSEDTWRVHFKCRANISAAQQGWTERNVGPNFAHTPDSLGGYFPDAYVTMGTTRSPWGVPCSWWGRSQWRAETNATLQVDVDVTLRAGVLIKATVVPGAGLQVPVVEAAERGFAPYELNPNRGAEDFNNAFVKLWSFFELSPAPWNVYPPQSSGTPFTSARLDMTEYHATIGPLVQATSGVGVVQDPSGVIRGHSAGTGSRPNLVLDAWLPASGNPWDMNSWSAMRRGEMWNELGYSEEAILGFMRGGLGLNAEYLPPEFDNPARHVPVNYTLRFDLRHKE